MSTSEYYKKGIWPTTDHAAELSRLTQQIANDTALWEARHDAQVEELEVHEATITTLTAERDQLRAEIAAAKAVVEKAAP